MSGRRRHDSRAQASPVRFLRRWFIRVNLIVALGLGGWYLAQPAVRQQEVRRLVSAAWARDKNVSAFDVAWDLWQLYYADAGKGLIAAGDKTHIYGGAPVPGLPANAASIRVLVNRGYVVGYDNSCGNPAWVAYRVNDLPAIPTPPPRPDKFSVDRRTAARVRPETYSGTGYDRGHLAPNFAIATRYGVAAQEETFLMSNITPQRHALNAGVWKELEQKIATSYPARYGEVWVLTGPIFGERPRELQGGVQIPEAFFLIVVDEHDGKLRTLALIVPQEASTSALLHQFLTTIDEIERRTRLDFLPELDDASETELEKFALTRVW